MTTLWGPMARETALVLREGASVRIVGSHHYWLEDVGQRCVLLLAVDDAAGVVANAVFRAPEDTMATLPS